MHHDDPLAGHFGRTETQELVSRKFSWKGLAEDVAAYVKACEVCQRTKSRRHRPYGELSSLPMPDRPWRQIAMDFITNLLPSKRAGCVYDSILVVVDRYSKMHRYLATTKRCTAAELAVLLRDEIVSKLGMPAGIVSDRGSVFPSAGASSASKRVKRRLSTTFHPQTDGQTERANQG